MENKIGCSSGRLHIIDPNKFEGNDSSKNIPVNNEDLTISVKLETFKSGRTVLTTEKDKSTSNSEGPIAINFIDGSNINGKRVLTTAYTDLTTLFDDNSTDSAGENLGITSIDIDFNSQLAPMITINFIDVRGSSIFQNEQYIKDGKNKYSTFFKLPYPLFKLTIKGYYGKPVEYCLHMTKFNSKFNSKTGNFEITSNFIGFTFAMMSDMLIGYLKAIPYTQKGGKIYDDINQIRKNNGIPEILNLNDLMISIATLNESIKKIAATDPSAVEISAVDSKTTTLTGIEDLVNNLGVSLDIKGKDKNITSTTRFPYIIKPDSLIPSPDLETVLSNFKNDITNKLVAYNKDLAPNLQLNVNNFTLSKSYINTTVDNAIKITDISRDGLHTIGELLTKYLNGYSGDLTSDTIFTFWDLTDAYASIDQAKLNLNNQKSVSSEELGHKIRNDIRSKIGFDPTIRNIIEIFTTAVEVFMKTIYEVSVEAQTDTTGKRKTQLKSKFVSNLTQDHKFDDIFFPWPGYRENKTVEGVEAYIEKYLGATNPKVLDIPSDVNELFFIDDLLNAFLKAAQKTEQALLLQTSSETTWVPVNALDTKVLGVSTEPYARIGKTGLSNEDPIVSLMLIRGMTFLGYTNSYLTDKEIRDFAVEEANAILSTIPDEKIKTILSNGTLTPTRIGDSVGKINDKTRRIVYQGLNSSSTLDTRVYGYFPTGGTTTLQNVTDYKKIIPIDDGFTGNWVLGTDNKWSVDGNSDVKYLTNYNNTNNIIKTNDGGVYIKILTKEDYANNQATVKVASVDTKVRKIVLTEIQKDVMTTSNMDKAGFNVFAGPYGIQEFSQMDWGKDTQLIDLPLRYVFYNFSSNGDGTEKVGLMSRNMKSGLNTSIYDLKTGENITAFKSETFKYDIDKRYDNIGFNRNLFAKLEKNDVNVTYPCIDLMLSEYASNGAGNGIRLSIFGSRWYYAQFASAFPMYSKALLFLNTLPWNDVPFKSNEIKHLFDIRGGFISVPKLWAAYVGGLIWRNDISAPILDTDGSIISGGSGSVDPIIWIHNSAPLLPVDSSGYHEPSRDKQIQYLSYNKTFTTIYTSLPTQILNMPEQGKNEFKKIFFDFVKNQYKSLHNELKIIKQTSTTIPTSFDDDMVTIYDFDATTATIYGLGDSLIFNNDIVSYLINTDKYIRISPVNKSDYHGFSLELQPDPSINNGNNPVKHILNMLKEEVIIANTGYNIWRDIDYQLNTDYFIVKTQISKFDTYFNEMVRNFKVSSYSTTAPGYINNTKKREQKIFRTTNEEAIKLQMYNICKNIFDKWLGGVADENEIFFRCGSRNTIDTGLMKKYRKGDSTLRLIDSFRFVDRAFMDIGDKMYINPTPINTYLIDSPNTSVYNAIGQLLASNHFNFLPLPTYINYKDAKTLASMFEPTSYFDDNIDKNNCGPTFVCVYAGGTSKHLDIAGGNYPNDGFDFQCPNNQLSTSIPKDFTGTSNDFEDDVAVFEVNYSQQNQNIFKDITLDQSEFSETDESLKISDDIANKGAENNVSLGGQNIYSVYSVRSYNAEVEMLGNAMIQPMMHFQLNNIPMFHGAYLIKRVKHSIKPNHMSTIFNGTRVRYPKTELLSGSDFYMGLLDSMELAGLGGKGSLTSPLGTSGSFVNRYLGDLKANIPTNKIIEGSVIDNKLALTQRAETELKNWNYGAVDEKDGVVFLDVYAKTTPSAGLTGSDYTSNVNPWSAIFISYIMLAGDRNFPKSPSHYSYITAAMNGKFGYEAFGLGQGLKIKPEVGDLMCIERQDGPTAAHCNVMYKVAGNTASFAGGNLSDSANSVNITLTDGYIVDGTDVNDYKIYIKKTNNKYYNNKAIIGTGKFPDDNGDGKTQIDTKLIYEELKKQLNYTDEGIAGVMGSMYQESRFKPTAQNPQGDYGLVQWTDVNKNTRKPEFLKYMSSNNLDKTSYINQITYIKYELTNVYKYTGKNLQTNTNVEDAAKVFYVTYEGGNLGTKNFTPAEVNHRLNQLNAADNTYTKRVSFANQFFNMIKNKNFYFPAG